MRRNIECVWYIIPWLSTVDSLYNISKVGSWALNTLAWDKAFGKQEEGWCHEGCTFKVFWTF